MNTVDEQHKKAKSHARVQRCITWKHTRLYKLCITTHDSAQRTSETKRGPMPSMRALSSMSTQPARRAHSPPAQPLAAILLSLAIPRMLLPTSPYRPSSPSPPILPCTLHSHPQISHPNHPARSTPHPRATHTKHTSPLPALLDGTGLL